MTILLMRVKVESKASTSKALVACVVSAVVLCGGCQRGESPAKAELSQAAGGQAAGISAESEARVIAFCGDCHAMPSPASFPKEAWRAEVLRGYEFYFASGRNDLAMPVQRDAVEYFVSRAPKHLTLEPPQPVAVKLRDQFRIEPVPVPGLDDAEVSFVDSIELEAPWENCLVFSDMRGGGVYLVPLQGDHAGAAQQIAKVKNPAAVRVVDWDGDGWKDLIVSDLGTYLPADTQEGAIHCLRQNPESPGTFSTRLLRGTMGRVASTEIMDVDQDGIEDLLVAEFGWHETGSIHWLRRSTSADPWAPLESRVIDSRPGTIHLPVVDLNSDGFPDFVALLSQHFEEIVAYTNDGRGNFQSRVLYAAPDPSFGSSGIELVDLNADGKLDILYSNGDSFDSFVLKPFHGVRWLENQGEEGFFREHFLGGLPGAHRAVAGDFDGDGLIDVLAGAFLPRDVLQSSAHRNSASLVLWHQQPRGEFRSLVLEDQTCIHAALICKDLNRDGSADFVVGNFREGGTLGGPPLEIWWAPAPPTR